MLLRRSRYRLAQIEHRLEVLGGYLVAYLNLDKVIKIIRTEDEPRPVLMKSFKLSEVQADAILNMRLRNLRRLEEMEIRQEDKDLRAEKKSLEELLRSEKQQWKKIAGQIREVRDTFGPKTPLGKRRTSFAEAPEHDEAAIEEALVEREPVTIVVSEKGWIRALRGQVADLSSLAFKTDDGFKLAFFAETTSKLLVFATNGRFYTIDASKLPGGRGHGEPIRLFADLEQDADIVSVFRYQGGRKFMVASKSGRGFVVPEDECLGNTRKGKQVLNVKPPDEARAMTPVEGDLVAAIGENRKMVVFPLDQVPEMTRGRGVRLQRHKDGGLSDIKVFEAEKGLSWTDSAGRVFNLSIKELADWRGNRADAGRLAPKGFPEDNKFANVSTANTRSAVTSTASGKGELARNGSCDLNRVRHGRASRRRAASLAGCPGHSARSMTLTSGCAGLSRALTRRDGTPSLRIIDERLSFDRRVLFARPAVRRQPLLRQEAALVVHLARAAHPIAEIDVGEPHAPGARDVVEHHEGAERTRRFVRFEKRIDHRQAVAEHVGERDGEKVAGAALDRRCRPARAAGIRRCGFRHGCPRPSWRSRAPSCRPCRRRGGGNRDRRGRPNIARRSAPRPACRRRCRRCAWRCGACCGVGRKSSADHAHRDAGAAALAGRPIGDRLAAAEAAMGEDIVEFGGALADQMGEDLPLLLAGQIGAGRGRGQVELRRVARMLGHGRSGVASQPATESGHRIASPENCPRSKAKSADQRRRAAAARPPRGPGC